MRESILITIMLMLAGVGCSTPVVRTDKPVERQQKDPMLAAKDKVEALSEKRAQEVEGTQKVNSSVGSYEAYSEPELEHAKDGTVVLFFKAPWCPTCRAVDSDIKAHLADIPPGVSILEVDYDSSDELKRKYGVTYQHTFVQVDAAGNLLKKWSGGLTLGSILKEIR